MRRQGYTTEEIARSYGWTTDAMRMYLRDYVTRDEMSFIFQADASSGTDEADAADAADANNPDVSDVDEEELVDEEEPVDDDDADNTANS